MLDSDIRPADLLIVSGRSLLDRAIEDITHSEWSHVAGYTSPDALIEAQAFRKVGYQDPGAYAGESVVYRCDLMTERRGRRALEYVERRIGFRYDYLLIGIELVRYTLGIVLPWREGHTRICSTLWADAYKSVGIELCPGIRWPSPGDLANSKLLRPIGRYV